MTNENNQGHKINVLFDAFQASQDSYTETCQHISILEKRVDKHDIEIAVLKATE